MADIKTDVPQTETETNDQGVSPIDHANKEALRPRPLYNFGKIPAWHPERAVTPGYLWMRSLSSDGGSCP